MNFVFQPAGSVSSMPGAVEGLAFLSPKPLDQTWFTRVSRFPGAGPSRVILTTSLAGIDVHNVHFPLREKARLLEARLLVRLVEARNQPAIIVGDFNSHCDDEPMLLLFAAGFVDRWGGSEAEWPHEDRIDYALSYRLKAESRLTAIPVEHGTRGPSPSDHPGLLLDLAF